MIKKIQNNSNQYDILKQEYDKLITRFSRNDITVAVKLYNQMEKIKTENKTDLETLNQLFENKFGNINNQ